MINKIKKMIGLVSDFLYALQELRVSLFAQELKTRYPISLKRVEKQWHEMMLK